ncbi:MAG: ATP-binding cassette domain-containing protein, partial [Gemmataceae bacterium]
SVVQFPEKARLLVGYVPDSLPTHRVISVHDYLDFFARAYGIQGQRRKQVVEGIEEFCNLTGIREKQVSALSKGMKNRVSVARALVHDPPILIMDEPAAGLDPRARVELRELLRVLSTQGKAILISSHILTELAEICNGAVIIERGRILRAGTLDQIVNQDQPHRSVVIRALEPTDVLQKRLLEMPGVERVRLLDQQGVEVDVLGNEQNCCELLASLVRGGVPVLEFRPQRLDLEQIFMNVTTGEVQ